MDTKATTPDPKPIMTHPNFSDEVNRDIVQSEIEGGVCLDDLPEGARLEVETQHRLYNILIRDRGKELIWGHPQYCPDPVAVRIAGSTWGGSMLKLRFMGEECAWNSGTPYFAPSKHHALWTSELQTARERCLSSRETDCPRMLPRPPTSLVLPAMVRFAPSPSDSE
jgi:hypothetical protein